jgi:hypothetical protein
MNIKTILRKAYLLGTMLALYTISDGQGNCDTALINAHLNPAGYQRLYVTGQPCSMYFYSTSAMYGIDAHIQAANLGVPQLVINNAQENSDVQAALYSQGVFNISPEVWMGITDSSTIYTWRTFAGAAAPAYTNWSTGEPNDMAPSCQIGSVCAFCFGADAYWCANGEDCAVMSASGQWLDITCRGDAVTHVNVLEVNTCPVLIKPADLTVCAGSSVTVSATDAGGTTPITYTWNPGGLNGQTVTLSPAATDTVTVQASDAFQCIVDSTFIININPDVPVANAGPDLALCPGSSDTLGAANNANYTYSWSPTLGLSSTSVADPTISLVTNPDTSNLELFYILTATWGSCSSLDTVHVTLYPNIDNNFTLSTQAICVNGNIIASYAGTPSGSATYSWTFDSATIVSGSGPGSYVLTWPTLGTKTITLSVTENGCTATPVSKIVTTYPKPVVTTSLIGSYTLTTNTTFNSYQWLENGSPLSGDTSQSYTATANGSYSVVVTDAFGCVDTSVAYTITGVGIADINGKSQIRIYPNPANDRLYISDAQANISFVISNVVGEELIKGQTTGSTQVIDISALPAGLYFINRIKFVKE